MHNISRVRTWFLWLIIGTSILAIALIVSSPTEATGAAADLFVDASAPQHVIDPNIYGIAWASAEQATAWDLPVNRWGGNLMSRYNWQLDSYNMGDWWYFENINNPDPGTLPSNSSSDKYIEQNISTGTNTLLQIPMVGWVPKDRNQTCSFPFDLYPDQTEFDFEYGRSCGNGVSSVTNESITGNDPTYTSKPVDASFGADWIAHLRSRYGAASQAGLYYQLGNEPMLWHYNHRDVHPEPASYDYVTAKGIEYGQMIKQADPTAQVMGPGVWGWQPYYYSGLDIVEFYANGDGRFPDREAHDNMPFLAWYLQEMRKFEEQNGYRILDYIDIHAYPQGFDEAYELFALGPAGTPETQAKRLRSTRELWDRSWIAESWINTEIYAINLMKDWIAENYPGTKIAISEYSWGANEHINGALAQADVLGIYGREDVGMAILWDPPELGQPVDHAIRMYRDYDGFGRKFGDISLPSSSTNEMELSVFAARRSTDGVVTVMVVNKTLTSQTSTLNIAGSVPSTAQVYRYSDANLNQIEHLGEQSLDSSGNVTMTFPRESITLFTFGETPILPAYYLPIMMH